MRMAAALWLPLAVASNCSLADGPSLRLASRIAAATAGCDVVAYTTLVYPAGVRFPHPSTRLGPGAANGTAGVCYVLVAGAASAASLREHCDVAPWRVVALDADAAGAATAASEPREAAAARAEGVFLISEGGGATCGDLCHQYERGSRTVASAGARVAPPGAPRAAACAR
ncbi:GTPase [Aureococcus anophagefferens]|nr:GTPase [Aureococcus anophagefferens]